MPPPKGDMMRIPPWASASQGWCGWASAAAPLAPASATTLATASVHSGASTAVWSSPSAVATRRGSSVADRQDGTMFPAAYDVTKSAPVGESGSIAMRHPSTTPIPKMAAVVPASSATLEESNTLAKARSMIRLRTCHRRVAAGNGCRRNSADGSGLNVPSETAPPPLPPPLCPPDPFLPSLALLSLALLRLPSDADEANRDAAAVAGQRRRIARPARERSIRSRKARRPPAPVTRPETLGPTQRPSGTSPWC